MTGLLLLRWALVACTPPASLELGNARAFPGGKNGWEKIIFCMNCVCKEWIEVRECFVPRLFDETSTGSRLKDLRHHEDTAKSL